MYVRLAFAVAAHLEPEILLVDEVLAVGDLGFQRKCLGKMEQVAKRGRTVLFVSHNMAAIQALCSRAILLENGRLTHDGRPDEAIGAYVSSVQKSMAEASLEARSDREGGTAFRFRSVVFRDAETGAPLNIVVSGRPVAIDVGYVSLTSVPLSEVVVAISFSNASGAFLSGCRSDAVGKSFRISPGPGQVVCRIPKFPFSQGRFNYHLIAYQQGTIVDWVRDAGYIDVTAGDYYGTGRIPAGALQSVFIDFDWRTTGAG
jgi:lipopolysaccharide transport system ATP-binding protein